MGQAEDFQKTKNALKRHSSKMMGYNEDKLFYQTIKPLFDKIQSPPLRPDAYAFEDGVLLVLEHFEIDGSETKEYGSVEHYKNGKTEIELKKQIQLFGKGMVIEEVSRSGKYYVESFTRSFKNHAAKIDEYLKKVKNLINEEIKETIVGFVVEDFSKLGFYVPFKENEQINYRQIDIMQSKEFLDLFESTPKLDFVLYTTTTFENNGYQRFISQKTIEKARNHEIIVADIPSTQHYTATYSYNLYLNIGETENPSDSEEQ